MTTTQPLIGITAILEAAKENHFKVSNPEDPFLKIPTNSCLKSLAQRAIIWMERDHPEFMAQCFKFHRFNGTDDLNLIQQVAVAITFLDKCDAVQLRGSNGYSTQNARNIIKDWVQENYPVDSNGLYMWRHAVAIAAKIDFPGNDSSYINLISDDIQYIGYKKGSLERAAKSMTKATIEQSDLRL